MPWEYLCDEHINAVEDTEEANNQDDLDALCYWVRYKPEEDPAFYCQHPGHDDGLHVVDGDDEEAEGDSPPAATWIAYSFAQIQHSYGPAVTPEPPVTPNDKLSEIIRMLQSQQRPPVLVSLKKSSSKDGNEGFDLDVVAGATVGDIEETITHALEGRKQILDTLYAPLSPDADA